MDIKSINSKEIIPFINSARQFLLNSYFKEFILPIYTSYSISNIEQIKTETEKTLRTTTEPEIWLIAEDSMKFFCITSLFRRENKESKLHKEEFRIIDFYKKQSTKDEILEIGIQMLENFEQQNNLRFLSKLNMIEIEHENFEKACKNILTPTIVNVTNYPVEESFYDEVNPETGKTYKGELFYIDDEHEIEFSVYGKVANNRNPVNKLIENSNIESYPDNLFGMCFGFERIILVYKILGLKLQNQ